MFKKVLISLAILCMNLGPQLANALNNIDNFISSNGIRACNGESPNCTDFYRKAVELNDDPSPVSPEIRFTLNNDLPKGPSAMPICAD